MGLFQGSVDINLKEGTFEYYMSKIYHTFLPALTLDYYLLLVIFNIYVMILLKILKDYVLTSKVKRIIYE